jgi:hypothetical protein
VEFRKYLNGGSISIFSYQFGNRFVGLMLPLIAQLLVEHQRQYVILVILAGSLVAQDVGCAL